MHVKTKSAWATNSAMGRGAVRRVLVALRGGVPAFPRAFRDDRRSQGRGFGPAPASSQGGGCETSLDVAKRRCRRASRQTLIASFHRILLFGATLDAARF